MIFIRYLSIQLLAYGIDLCMFLIILHIGVAEPVLANIVAKFSAGLFAFSAHRLFTFRVGGVGASGQAIRYFVLLLLNIPIASTILALLLVWLAEPVVAKFIADIICVGLTFLLSKHFIFADRSKKNGSVEVNV